MHEESDEEGDEERADAEQQQCRLLYQALRQAARTRLGDAARPLAATDLSLVFSTAAEGQLQLQARGQVTGGGRSVCFCEAELLDAAQRTVARAMGTFRYQQGGAVQR